MEIKHKKREKKTHTLLAFGLFVLVLSLPRQEGQKPIALGIWKPWRLLHGHAASRGLKIKGYPFIRLFVGAPEKTPFDIKSIELSLISFHIIGYNLTQCHIIKYNLISSDIISYNLISSHIIPYQRIESKKYLQFESPKKRAGREQWRCLLDLEAAVMDFWWEYMMHHDAPDRLNIAFTGPPPKLNLEPKNDGFPQGIGLQRPQVFTDPMWKFQGSIFFPGSINSLCLGIVIPFHRNLYDGYIYPT